MNGTDNGPLRLMKRIATLEPHLKAVFDERDQLRRDLAKSTSESEARAEELIARKRFLWAPPGHFYSPIVDPADLQVLQACQQTGPMTPPGVLSGEIRCDESAMLDLFNHFSKLYPELTFTDEKTTANRYYYDNPAFSYADGITLFCFLRHFLPSRLIEVGSGYSSCVSMDTNDRFFNGSILLTFIEPFPKTLLSLLDESDSYRNCVRQERLQDVSLEFFSSLHENDILFIDSSHVAKMASDVNYYMFQILPRLRKGVIIHIHDIFSSFEYPYDWVVTENRSWNELYLIRAFLQFNSAFEVIYFNDLIYNKYRTLTADHMPLCLRNTGGSIWLRKTS